MTCLFQCKLLAVNFRCSIVQNYYVSSKATHFFVGCECVVGDNISVVRGFAFYSYRDYHVILLLYIILEGKEYHRSIVVSIKLQFIISLL